MGMENPKLGIAGAAAWPAGQHTLRDAYRSALTDAQLQAPQITVNSATIAAWHWDLQGQYITWSSSAGALAERCNTLAGLIACIHPDDRRTFEREVAAATTSRREHRLELRMLDAQGGARWHMWQCQSSLLPQDRKSTRLNSSH